MAVLLEGKHTFDGVIGFGQIGLVGVVIDRQSMPI
jgi:hypothetical protein